jgi:hypothetical protein
VRCQSPLTPLPDHPTSVLRGSSIGIAPGRARPCNTRGDAKISANPEYFRARALLTNGHISTENRRFATPRMTPMSYGSGSQSEFPAKTRRPRARATCRSCGHSGARVQALHPHLHTTTAERRFTFGQPGVLMIRYAPRREGRGGRGDARRSEEAAMLTADERRVPDAECRGRTSPRQRANTSFGLPDPAN